MIEKQSSQIHTSQIQKRIFWRTRFGFYMAAIGSACGLGNLWRFPYVVSENGGGAFVLLYVMLASLVGLPFLISELSLGKSSRRSVVFAIEELAHKTGIRLKGFAIATVLLSLVVLSYYAVVSGWVLHFFVQFMVGFIHPQSLESRASLQPLMNNGWLQIMLASVHLLLTVIVVVKGVQEGLEKWISYVMPIFGLLMIFLIYKAVTLPSFSSAARFLFYPDFSKLTLSSLSHAVGHVLFTLSIGFGTMVTFGSYLRENDHIPTAGFRVATVDTLLSLVSGLVIFSIVLMATPAVLNDPSLLFEYLPKFLTQIKGGAFFGLIFFLSLYLAALGASIGLLEVIVSNLVDKKRFSRDVSTWATGFVALIVATIPALSSSVFKQVNISNKSILEVWDSVLINWILPVIAIGISFAVSWGFSEREKEKLFIDQNKPVSEALYGHWKFAIRWLAPFIVVLAFILQILNQI